MDKVAIRSPTYDQSVIEEFDDYFEMDGYICIKDQYDVVWKKDDEIITWAKRVCFLFFHDLKF